jgi:hypothetical protein
MNQQYCNGMIHVIKQGDNLYQLSRKYRVPLGLILRANPYVDVYNLQPGQEICIPVGRPYPGLLPGFGRKPQMPNPPVMEKPETPQPPESEPEKPPAPQPRGEEELPIVEAEMEEEDSMEKPEIASAERAEYICDGKTNLGQLLQQHNMSVAEFLESNSCDTIIPAEGTKLQL